MTAALPEESDYVVVGAGAAGCVVARRLAENGTASVTLIEAGPDDRDWKLHVPLLSMLIMGQDRYNWNFDTEAVPGLGGRALRLLAGKLLGGSSSINGLIYTRGAPSEYDRWRDMGCTGWGFDDVLPFILKSEGSTRGDNCWHSARGPWPIRHAKSALPIYSEFLRAAQEAGIPVVDDLCADVGEGVGFYDVNVSSQGRRMSAAAAYLRQRPSNLRVITGATATRIKIENGRATGVEVNYEGDCRLITVRGEVILSAGAINSPKLLMLSGVGDAAQLASKGVSVRHDLPGVGRNLQNHACYTLQYSCSRPISAYRYLNPVRAVAAAAQFLGYGRGPFAETPFAVGGSFRTDPDLATADMHLTVFSALILGSEKPWPMLSRLGPGALLPNRHGFGITLSQGVPYSRGTVSIGSTDPAATPIIRPNYFDDPRDMATLTTAVECIRKLVRSSALGKIVEAELVPGADVPDDEIVDSIRRHGSTFYHQCGTCAMGSGKEAVVDPRLRVRGIDRLRVADASIMPLILNATPHASTIMIGEKAAAMIAEDRCV